MRSLTKPGGFPCLAMPHFVAEKLRILPTKNWAGYVYVSAEATSFRRRCPWSATGRRELKKFTEDGKSILSILIQKISELFGIWKPLKLGQISWSKPERNQMVPGTGPQKRVRNLIIWTSSDMTWRLGGHDGRSQSLRTVSRWPGSPLASGPRCRVVEPQSDMLDHVGRLNQWNPRILMFWLIVFCAVTATHELLRTQCGHFTNWHLSQVDFWIFHSNRFHLIQATETKANEISRFYLLALKSNGDLSTSSTSCLCGASARWV